MPGTPLTLTPLHLVRVGTGLDGIRVQARGHGIILGSLGFLLVRGSLDGLLYRRLRGSRCRVLFLGFHGVAWVSMALPPAARTSVPVALPARIPELPPLQALPSLRVQLTVTPPEPPVHEGLP
jgi:hypothetical protein